MKYAITIIFAGMLFLFASAKSQASEITYQVDLSSLGNTLTGSITTDGTIGDITLANIVDWSFSATGITSFQISAADFGGAACIGSVTAACFTATSTALSFNFGSPSYQDPFTKFSGMAGSVSFFDSYPSPEYAGVVMDDFYNQASTHIQIATQTQIASVPEPSTTAQLVVGLGIVGLGISRRKAKLRR